MSTLIAGLVKNQRAESDVRRCLQYAQECAQRGINIADNTASFASVTRPGVTYKVYGLGTHMQCSCPQGLLPICKHRVALLHVLAGATPQQLITSLGTEAGSRTSTKRAAQMLSAMRDNLAALHQAAVQEDAQAPANAHVEAVPHAQMPAELHTQVIAGLPARAGVSTDAPAPASQPTEQSQQADAPEQDQLEGSPHTSPGPCKYGPPSQVYGPTGTLVGDLALHVRDMLHPGRLTGAGIARELRAIADMCAMHPDADPHELRLALGFGVADRLHEIAAAVFSPPVSPADQTQERGVPVSSPVREASAWQVGSDCEHDTGLSVGEGMDGRDGGVGRGMDVDGVVLAGAVTGPHAGAPTSPMAIDGTYTSDIPFHSAKWRGKRVPAPSTAGAPQAHAQVLALLSAQQEPRDGLEPATQAAALLQAGAVSGIHRARAENPGKKSGPILKRAEVSALSQPEHKRHAQQQQPQHQHALALPSGNMASTGLAPAPAAASAPAARRGQCRAYKRDGERCVANASATPDLCGNHRNYTGRLAPEFGGQQASVTVPTTATVPTLTMQQQQATSTQHHHQQQQATPMQQQQHTTTALMPGVMPQEHPGQLRLPTTPMPPLSLNYPFQQPTHPQDVQSQLQAMLGWPLFATAQLPQPGTQAGLVATLPSLMPPGWPQQQ